MSTTTSTTLSFIDSMCRIQYRPAPPTTAATAGFSPSLMSIPRPHIWQITQCLVFLVGCSSAVLHLFIKHRVTGQRVYNLCLSNMGQELAVVINCNYLTPLMPLTPLFVGFFTRSFILERNSSSSNKTVAVRIGAIKSPTVPCRIMVYIYVCGKEDS